MNFELRPSNFALLLVALLSLPAAAVAQLAPSNPPPAVTLAWDHSPGPGVAGYKLYWGTSSGAYTRIETVTYTNQARLTGLFTRGVTYYFAATAFAADGLESVFSNEVSWTAPQVPGPPTKLRIVLVTTPAGARLILTPDTLLADAATLEASHNLKTWFRLAELGGLTGLLAYDDTPAWPMRLYRLN